ncbi:hypothetical protein OEZ85_011607 [Tetradesmus obliquus]|uniref:Uncharacterized protein n=1 Tax=Tetradesmus obliquus TaxID=3088 RepID=A0ABY8TRL2_TETOB|nr:hypothetical protein OEZ85_011607 [Tetradesmus obliquus]
MPQRLPCRPQHRSQEQASKGNNTAACTGRPAVTSLSGGTSARLKCSSIYLGGSKDGTGCCRPMQPAPCCCDRLKCLSCDFQVLWHADARWAADVDYMFFRNSYGVAAQTSLKLQPCRGSAAMCCQCSWASCSRPTKLADAAEQAGHQLRKQQQGAGEVQLVPSGSQALCRTSGLGSFRQQVWLQSLPSEGGLVNLCSTQEEQQLKSEQAKQEDVGAAEAAAAAAAAAEKGLTVSQPGTAAAAAAAAGGDVSSRAAELKLLPNLGYACLCMTMRQYDVFNSRDCVKKTRDGPGGLAKVSELALANARDLLPLIRWNEAHGIRLFRLSSCILPWMTSYKPEELPDWLEIQAALRAAGDLAKQLGHRLTFHPSEFCKIAGERPAWVTQSVAELEVHSRIFDEMGFLPASPYNKINIHVGGTYGGPKEDTLRRFAQVVNERLSPNCKARLTVENDDRASQYSVADLQLVHQLTGISIVFDFHHWKFCTGGQTQEEAFKSAVATWPPGVRPMVHWSECPEDPAKRRSAHSEYIDGPVNLYGLEGQVDVMIEAKAKELSLLEYRQAVLHGWQVRPRLRNSKFGDATAGPDLPPAEASTAEEGEEEGDGVAEEEEDA